MTSESKNFSEILTLGTLISPQDAIAQLGEALGQSDKEVLKLFPELLGYADQVELDILKEEDNLDGPDYGDMIIIRSSEKDHRKLNCGYYPETGERLMILGDTGNVRHLETGWTL